LNDKEKVNVVFLFWFGGGNGAGDTGKIKKGKVLKYWEKILGKFKLILIMARVRLTRISEVREKVVTVFLNEGVFFKKKI